MSQAVPPSSEKVSLVHRSPFYYGWIIVAVGTLGMWMTSPGQTYVFSVFIDWFIVDLGISRTLVSSLYMVGTLLASMSLPFVGRFFDRHGSRRTVVWVSLGLGLATMAMSQVNGPVFLFFGILLLRGLGQGSLQMSSDNAIAQWFIKNRGKAIGVASLGASMAMGVFPLITLAIIDGVGWRRAYVVLGIIVLTTILPAAAAFLRDRPEDFGLIPDGGSVDSDEVQPTIEEHWRLKEAVRTPAFWIISLSIIMISAIGTGLMFHQISIFDSAGLDAQLAAANYFPIALFAALATVVTGFLLDRVRKALVLVVAMLFLAGSLVMVQLMNSASTAFAYGVTLGIAQGMFRPIGSVLLPGFFGRRYLGEIMGFVSMLTAGASAFGPFPMGMAFDLFGGYNEVLRLFMVFPLVMAVASLFLKRPSRPTCPSSS